MTLKSIFSLLLLSTFIVACQSNPLDVDVSNVKLKLKFVNIDQALYKTPKKKLISAHRGFKKNAKDVYLFNLAACYEIDPKVSDTGFVSQVLDYRKDEVAMSLEREIARKFTKKKKKEIEANLIDGFKHLKYHLPRHKRPKYIAFMNSLMRVSIHCEKTGIGIGLERYLGSTASFYKKLNPRYHHEWMKKAMKTEYIERDVIAGWIDRHYFGGKAASGNLAERMIRWGKTLYLTKAAFPNMEDHLIVRYTKSDYRWAKKNELGMWKYLVDQKLLFSKEELTMMNMLNPGPTTSGLPQDGAPDRMGKYLGYQMVKKFMEKTGTDVGKLLNTPYNDILQQYEVEE